MILRAIMKILYYDCFAGISGDMHLGAMIDAGVDPHHLLAELKKLPLDGYKVNITRDQRKSIEGTRVDIVVEGNHGHHHHHGHDHHHEHDHKDEHHHHHHDNDGHHHHHEHRNLADIKKIISDSSLPEKTKSRAMKMFLLIAEAEAKIHGVSVDEIHFHEVGAVDSIVDITGAAICLEYLNPDRILGSTIELGSGMVKCAHGLMPVPAPATAEILKNIPVKIGSTPHEATTPTGAAILAANVDEFTDQMNFKPLKTAYGIGQRDTELPNILRVYLGEMDEKALSTGNCTLIECNIDDMNPEFYGDVMDNLFDAGALDVFITPTIMKKNRPAVILSVLCDQKDQQKMSEILLKQTTTLGVRYQTVSRLMLDRDTETVFTSLGKVAVKQAWFQGKLLKWKPEYEDCKLLADKNSLSLREVYEIVESEINAMKTEMNKQTD